MSYPKQLQLFDKTAISSGVGTPGFAGKTIFSAGFTVLEPYTVNMTIRLLEETYTDYITTIDHVRHAPRFRPFDTAFGDVVVFPANTTFSKKQNAQGLITTLRGLWDIDRAVSPNSIGYATSVQN